MVTRYSIVASAVVSVLCGLATPAAADFRLERRLGLQPGGVFTISVPRGAVNVVGSESGTSSLTVTSGDSNFAHFFRLDVSDRAAATRITLTRRDNWWEWLVHGWWWSHAQGATFTVRVPITTHVYVHTSAGPVHAARITGAVELRTAGGSVRVQDIDGPVNASTSGGPIEASDIRGTLAVRTAGGSIRIGRVQGATEAHTSGGPIEASDIAGRVSLRTAGGSVRIGRVEGDVNTSTSGGPIDAANVRGNVFARTASGSIAIRTVRGDAYAQTSGGPLDLNDISGAITARTSGGGVRITAAGSRIDAHSSGGPVNVGFAPGNRSGGSVSATGGPVIAALDPSVALSIDAAGDGGVVSDIPLLSRADYSRHRLRGDLNGGGPSLRLRSSGGRVHIRAATR